MWSNCRSFHSLLSGITLASPSTIPNPSLESTSLCIRMSLLTIFSHALRCFLPHTWLFWCWFTGWESLEWQRAISWRCWIDSHLQSPYPASASSAWTVVGSNEAGSHITWKLLLPIGWHPYSLHCSLNSPESWFLFWQMNWKRRCWGRVRRNWGRLRWSWCCTCPCWVCDFSILLGVALGNWEISPA